jgi:hypothetical protein
VRVPSGDDGVDGNGNGGGDGYSVGDSYSDHSIRST